MGLRDIALSVSDPVRPWGEHEVLLLYGLLAPYLTGYLHGKTLASKNWMVSGRPFLIKRGSYDLPLFINELAEAITPEFLEMRRDIRSLERARGSISEEQELVWQYFLPRKLSDFFYATNGESGSKIERIFIDLDRGAGISAETAQQATLSLARHIMVSDFIDLIRALFPSWTGRSFHLILILREPQPLTLYERLRYEKGRLETDLEQWVAALSEEGFPVIGGHEKQAGVLTIDPSQTPPGKLCRVPLGALHMRDAGTVDGVSVPLTMDLLEDENLSKELKKYTPRMVVEEIDLLAKRLPL